MISLFLAGWKTDGCSMVPGSDNSATVQCECNHLTNFAVLAVGIDTACVC